MLLVYKCDKLSTRRVTGLQ